MPVNIPGTDIVLTGGVGPESLITVGGHVFKNIGGFNNTDRGIFIPELELPENMRNLGIITDPIDATSYRGFGNRFAHQRASVMDAAGAVQKLYSDLGLQEEASGLGALINSKEYNPDFADSPEKAGELLSKQVNLIGEALAHVVDVEENNPNFKTAFNNFNLELDKFQLRNLKREQRDLEIVAENTKKYAGLNIDAPHFAGEHERATTRLNEINPRIAALTAGIGSGIPISNYLGTEDVPGEPVIPEEVPVPGEPVIPGGIPIPGGGTIGIPSLNITRLPRLPDLNLNIQPLASTLPDLNLNRITSNLPALDFINTRGGGNLNEMFGGLSRGDQVQASSSLPDLGKEPSPEFSPTFGSVFSAKQKPTKGLAFLV